MLTKYCSDIGWSRLATRRYTTPLCICYEAETLAASSFLLAYTLLSDVLPQSELPQNWTDQFDIDWSDEEDVQEVDTVVQRMLDIWTSGARNEKIQLAGNDLKQVSQKGSRRFFRISSWNGGYAQCADSTSLY